MLKVALKLLAQGPRTLHTNTAKNAVIFHTHYNFFLNCKDFFNSFLYEQLFLRDFFKKIFAVLCVVCKGIHTFMSLQFFYQTSLQQQHNDHHDSTRLLSIGDKCHDLQ